MSAAAQFQMLELSKLGESPLNPRKSFDEKKQGELDASVLAKGVLEPLLVRPHGKVFEVVAGARRYRAAVKAGIDKVPCLVRELSDIEALEVAILENVCRADISAMDEGDAYRELVKLGQTVETIVEKTGRSRTIVFQRMKLAELQGEARELVLTGQWSPSIGELIARLPTEKAQQAAMRRLQDKQKYNTDGVAGIAFRTAKEILDDEFVLQLKAATFDVKDEELIPGAGACGACPKRTHAEDNREQFADVKSDTCLDEHCWNQKKNASFRLLQAEAAANGKKLVKEKNLLANHYGSGPAPLTSLAAEKYSKPSDEVLGEKTWKDLLGAEVPKVVVIDGDQKTHNLVDRKAAIALLEAKDPKAAAKLKEKPAAKEDDWQARNKADSKKREAQMAVDRVVRTKAIATVTKLDVALSLLVSSWANSDYDWKYALAGAGLPKGTNHEKLKPAQLVALIVTKALEYHEEVEKAAKLVKLDLKALTKKALAAEVGTCFACGCVEEKACKGGCTWVNEQKTLCSACGGAGEAE